MVGPSCSLQISNLSWWGAGPCGAHLHHAYWGVQTVSSWRGTWGGDLGAWAPGILIAFPTSPFVMLTIFFLTTMLIDAHCKNMSKVELLRGSPELG